ncbi:MAG: CSLREA domain-containing protein [Xanthomonadales bacterium]|nr:CSLREA domain-containing protein [Xanthomonadales bacterium]
MATFKPLRALLPLSLIMLTAPLAAAEFVVNSTADAPDTNPGDGACTGFGLPPSARCTLRAAIMEANAQGGTHLIGLPQGEYMLDEAGSNEDLAVTGDLDIRSDITIVNGSAEFPVIRQDIGDRFFDVHPGAHLKLQHIAMASGDVTATAVPLGGAVRIANAGELLLERSYIYGSRAAKGGAIYSEGHLVITDSDLQYNFLVDPAPDDQNQGSAIAMRTGNIGFADLAIVNSSLSDNGEVVFGGDLVPNTYALLVEDGALAQLSNASITGNTRGIWARGGSRLQLLMSTVAANESFGLRFDHDANSADVQLFVTHSVITGNGAVSQCRSQSNFFINANLAQIQTSNSYNAAGDASCGFDGTLDRQLASWPFRNSPVQHGVVRYFLPLPGGGLVDTGHDGCALDEDLRGKARPINATGLAMANCDIGAVEFDPQTDAALIDALFNDSFED